MTCLRPSECEQNNHYLDYDELFPNRDTRNSSTENNAIFRHDAPHPFQLEIDAKWV